MRIKIQRNESPSPEVCVPPRLPEELPSWSPSVSLGAAALPIIQPPGVAAEATGHGVSPIPRPCFAKRVKVNRIHQNMPAPAPKPPNLAQQQYVLRPKLVLPAMVHSRRAVTSGGKEIEKTNVRHRRKKNPFRCATIAQRDWPVPRCSFNPTRFYLRFQLVCI